MLAPTLGDLVERLISEGQDALSTDLRHLALVGPALGVEDDEWSFRTGGAVVVRSQTSEDTVVDASYQVHFVRKAKPGPFSDTVLIGRSETNDIVLPDASISKLHARLRAQGGALTLFDAGSSNGTYIGRERLVPDRPYELSAGVHMMFGECSFQLLAPGALLDVILSMANG
jgi:hypothetical protein